MTDEPKLTVHIDSSEKAIHLPEYNQDLPCPTCGKPAETGFGLAGGGYGIYSYCPEHGTLTKSTTEE